MDELLLRVERYFDTAPRAHARVEQAGPFTLFVGDPNGWTFYARPRLEPGTDGLVYEADAVRAALDRLRELGLPPAVEWVHEMTPTLLEAVRAEGSLEVEEIPLMVLGQARVRAEPPPEVTVQVIGADDTEQLVQARAVTALAFGAPATVPAGAGVPERDTATEPVPAQVRDALTAGQVGWVVATTPTHGVVASGRHLPLGDTTEVAGVATLPAFRGRGLASAVTDALVDHAVTGGVRTVLLTASSPDVARLYARLGFERIGTGYAAT